MSEAHERLAGVTRLALHGRRGPSDAFVFDPHRLALPCWALALDDAGVLGPATLVTLDRHFDLVPPRDPAAVPDRSAGLRALDEHARWALDPRNFDHVIAAMEAGLVGDVVALARSRPRGAIDHEWIDRRGATHFVRGFGDVPALAASRWVPQGPVLLDVDLDCFTDLSEREPGEVTAWDAARIRAFLAPEAPLWDALLARTAALTFAREPYHCGGLLAAGRLFETAARILFGELLGAEPP